MRFKSPWITTDEFSNRPIINVFHKQYEPVELEASAFENYHAAFRGKFTARIGADYSVRISADDLYKLYINGVFVGQGVKQGINESYSYNVFDITPFVSDGENSIVIHAYYFGRISRGLQSGDNRFGAVCDILENGSVIGGTDGTWRCSRLREYAGSVTCGYDTAFLEDIDFRLEQKGWRGKLFDDSAWEIAVENRNDDHVFRDKPAEAVEVEFLKPVSVKALSDRHFIIGFGHELVGQFYMEMSGVCGQSVKVLCGEELNEDGHVRYDMRCSTKYEETCTLSGGIDEFLFFDYKAFRYVEIKTDGEGVDPETFAAFFRHHRLDPKIHLETDNALLQDIWNLCVHSIRCGAQECVVDCPHREKGQYVGDWVVSGMTHLYLTGDRDYFLGIVQDFADSCRICPGMMGVAPGSFMQEIADCSMAFIIALHRYYTHTRDKEGVLTYLPVAQGIIDHFRKYEREDGLLQGVSDKWNLVDWPDNLRDGYDFPLPDPPVKEGCHNVMNALYIGALMRLNDLYEEFGLPCDRTAERRITDSFVRVFYDPARKLFRDAEGSSHCALHANIYPACFKFLPEEARETVTEFIVGKGLSCGIYVGFYVLEALVSLGAERQAFEMIVNEGKNGWANMLREGATVTFEAWGKDQKWNTSLCHAWGAYPILLLCDYFDGKFGVNIVKDN